MRTARPLVLGLLVLQVAGIPSAAHAGLERSAPQPAVPRESGLQRLPPGVAPPRSEDAAPARPGADGTATPTDAPREGSSADFRPPPIQGHVTDEAGVLDDAERARLEARLAQLRRESGYEVAIFVPSSLQGQSIEDVAYATFQAWRLGQAEPDNGVLLVVAPAERRMRIETGKGVGGELTDLQASRILRDAIAPRLRANDWAGALTAGADGIARALTGRPLPAAPGQTGMPRGPGDGVGGSGPEVVVGGGSPLMCLLFALFALFVLSRFFGGPRGGRRRRGGIIFVPPFFGGGWRSGGFGGRDDGFRGGGDDSFRGGGGGESGGGGASGGW